MRITMSDWLGYPLPFFGSGASPLSRAIKERRPRRGAVAAFCLVLFVAGVARGEFKLLEPHSETRVPRIETFVAAEAFKIGSTIGNHTLSAVGLNFAEHFLGLVETNVPEGKLNAWTLLYTSGDKSLFDASGGEKGVVRYIAHIHQLMELGEKGPSHSDWRSNFAYVRSPVDHRLWAVHWSVNYSNEWNIGAVYVPNPAMDWRSGSRLFSDQAAPLESSTTCLHRDC